jgi:hypothetical protein
MKRGMGWVVVGTLAGLAACRQDATRVAPPEPDPLVLSQDLSSKCFHWPAVDFTRTNMADALASLSAGDPAVEFELKTVDGQPYRLSELLATQPVLLVLGSYT